MRHHGTTTKSNASHFILPIIAVVLAISLAIAETAGAHAASVFGPHARTIQSDVVFVRFISPDTIDPVVPGVGTNRYSYSHNDPINKSDPTGHICLPCGLAIGIIGSLLSGTTEANTPELDEDVEDTSDIEALGNMAIGAIPGAATERLAAATIGRILGSRISVWSLGNATRGFVIETKLGANLSRTFRTIDSWDQARGIAKSIKSININDKKYSDPRNLERQLKAYLNEVKNFSGATGYNRQGKAIVISGKSIKKKELEIAVPNRPTKAQQKAIDAVKAEGKSSGIDVKTTVVK